jgi:hypothetical protein
MSERSWKRASIGKGHLRIGTTERVKLARAGEGRTLVDSVTVQLGDDLVKDDKDPTPLGVVGREILLLGREDVVDKGVRVLEGLGTWREGQGTADRWSQIGSGG